MASTFESVPTEILQDICAILDTVHPTSLLAFARASKHCYSVASTVLYRTVKVAITDQAPFQFLHGLEARLLRDNAFEHVRRVIICLPEDDFAPHHWPYSSLEQCERAFEDDTGLRSCWDAFGCEYYPNEVFIAEYEWKPVIRLVERLPGLTDLYWVRSEKLPLRLLNALDSKTKLCRLHHYTFRLGAPPLNSYEHALVTSPSLYSIGNLDRHTAALESARDIRSPNLRRVYLCSNGDMVKQDVVDEHENEKVRVPVPREVIQMESKGIEPIPFSTVHAEAFGDFSALRVLTLHNSVETKHLPSASHFPSLDTLAYTCDVIRSDTPQSWDELSTFLRNLPRLATLEIYRWDQNISFVAALNSNLRTLQLKTWAASDGAHLRDDHIHALADHCPNLENLDIEIPRSRGDAAEVSCYQSLGRLGQLMELHIELLASPPNCVQISADGCSEATSDTVIEPWFNEQDAEYLIGGLAPYRQGHVRDLLINRAVDEGLARAIFQVISDTKLKSVGQLPAVPLEQLELRASGRNYFPGCENSVLVFMMTPIHWFLRILDQKWLIKRDIRDDAREILHAHQIGGDWDTTSDLRTGSDRVKDDPYWFGIWRRVWPGKDGMSWWEGWKSRPLALDDGGK